MSAAAVETERLRLRRIAPGDHDPYFQKIYADDAVMRTLPFGAAIDRDVFERVVQSLMIDPWNEHGFGPWLVERRDDGQLLGHCGLRYWPGSDDVEVLYALARDAWDRGYATEAARASVAYGFQELGLARIIAAILPENTASRRVLEKLGMRETGPFRFGTLEVVGFELLASEIGD